MSFIIRLRRIVSKRSAVDVAKRLLENAFKSALKQTHYLTLKRLSVTLHEDGHRAEAELSGRVSEEYQSQFISALAAILSEKFSPPWVIMGGSEVEVAASGGTNGEDEIVKVPERPIGQVNTTFPPGTFSRIYGRDAQIRRIQDAIQIGKDTNWTKRKHTLLSGPPGTGKTELCLTLARASGQEGESWLWFDATSTTKAGALEQLMKAPVLPPLLFVEEIEKVPENALRWLLSIMDERGEIRRTNYRVGNQVRSVRLTVIATANNVALLQAMDSGSIYSRFGNRIHCPTPDRATMCQILNREVSEIGGNPEWVSATVTFGFDTLKITDCRELLNILLCGRDRLLNGLYQRDFLETLPPEDREHLGLENSTIEKLLAGG
jgi:hypothetical protein